MMQHSQIKSSEPAVQQDLATLRGEMRQLRKMVRLADQRAAWPAAPPPTGVHERSAVERRVREMLKWRRKRETIFGSELFADPAWDILLEMYAAELSDRRITISDLCVGAVVPPTTGQRWLKVLEKKGLIVRRDDPLDQRRVFMSLANEISGMLAEFFRRMPPELVCS